MDFNSIIFPAPCDDKYNQIENNLNNLLFVPKYKEDKRLFHIPCMFQPSKKQPITNKIFLYFHGNAEDIFNATNNVGVINATLPFNTICMEYAIIKSVVSAVVYAGNITISHLHIAISAKLRICINPNAAPTVFDMNIGHK